MLCLKRTCSLIATHDCLCARDAAYYRPVELFCGECGAQKTEPTLERIQAGRAWPDRCAKCYESTPVGARDRALFRARRRAEDRVRMARTALDAKTAAGV